MKIIKALRKQNNKTDPTKLHSNVLKFIKLIDESEHIYLGDRDDVVSMMNNSRKYITRPPFDKCFFEMSCGNSGSIGYIFCVTNEDEYDNKSFDLEIITVRLVSGKVDFGTFGVRIKSKLRDSDDYMLVDFMTLHDGATPLTEEEENTLIDSVSMVFNTFEAIACSNVELVDNIKYKKKLNGRKGKGLPLYSYKTLHIKPNKTTNKNISDAIGTHASPRLHLRRGHIRKLASGITVWVQSCMVGTQDNGIIEKDYVVGV